MDPLLRLSPSLRTACKRAAATARGRLEQSSRGCGPSLRLLDPGVFVPRQWEGLGRSKASSLDPVPPRCGRFVAQSLTSIVNKDEQRYLATVLQSACELVPRTKGDASIAPPLASAIQDLGLSSLEDDEVLPGGYGFRAAVLVEHAVGNMAKGISDSFRVEVSGLHDQ